MFQLTHSNILTHMLSLLDLHFWSGMDFLQQNVLNVNLHLELRWCFLSAAESSLHCNVCAENSLIFSWICTKVIRSILNDVKQWVEVLCSNLISGLLGTHLYFVLNTITCFISTVYYYWWLYLDLVLLVN